MNEYYTPPDDLVPFTKAKTSQINELKNSVDVGFDNLPTDLSGLKQEIIDARNGESTLLVRVTAAEAATAADVVSCQEALSDCQDEVVNCQDEVVNCQTEVGNCRAQVVLATTQADLAELYANNIVFNPESSSSTTSLTIGTGAKSLTIETGKSLIAGMWVVVIDKTNPAQYMKGYVSDYDYGSGSLDVSVVQVQGAGLTSASWLIAQTSPVVASEYSPVSFKGLAMAEMF